MPNSLWHIDGYHKLIRWRMVFSDGRYLKFYFDTITITFALSIDDTEYDTEYTSSAHVQVVVHVFTTVIIFIKND
jgi:hypothetical protein